MISERPGTPAADLRGTVQQAIADLAEVGQRLPAVTAGDAGRAAATLDRLSEEMAEAAAMARALPAEPSPQAGHTFAAAAAILTAARHEPDFAGWLATVLRSAARERDTPLVARPPGSWEAWLLLQLLQGWPAATSPPAPQTAGPSPALPAVAASQAGRRP
jgi:hypothetical protein